MVCSTDFILKYNELFKCLHKYGGKQAVIDFWEKLADVICGELQEKVKTKGLAGAIEYWSNTLSQENADCEITFVHNSEEEKLIIRMKKCPSLAKLECPYEHYCDHCFVLYNRVLNPLGYNFTTAIGDGGCLIMIKKG